MNGPNGPGSPTYNLFLCPHCEAELNPGHSPIIRMSGRLDAPEFSVTTEVFLPAGLGVYGRLTATGVTLREGAKIQFACPECGEPFSESDDDELAQVRMAGDGGKTYMVSFNKNYGKRSTFVIDPDGRSVERQFGDDADEFRDTLDKRLNWFGS